MTNKIEITEEQLRDLVAACFEEGCKLGFDTGYAHLDLHVTDLYEESGSKTALDTTISIHKHFQRVKAMQNLFRFPA